MMVSVASNFACYSFEQSNRLTKQHTHTHTYIRKKAKQRKLARSLKHRFLPPFGNYQPKKEFKTFDDRLRFENIFSQNSKKEKENNDCKWRPDHVFVYSYYRHLLSFLNIKCLHSYNCVYISRERKFRIKQHKLTYSYLFFGGSIPLLHWQL